MDKITHSCTQEDRITRIENAQKSDNSILKDLKESLLPSEFHPDNGIINHVKHLKDDVSEIKKDIYRFKAQLATIFSIGGLLLILIELYFKIRNGN